MRFPIPRIFSGLPAALLVGIVFFSIATPASAQLFGRRMPPASASISRQEPPKVSPRVLERINPDNAHVLISLSKQRAYLMVNGEIGIDSPISSGKAAGMTHAGSFRVQEKDPNHRSNIYGNFVDRQGRVVRAGVSVRIDSAPSGSHFEGAPMTWFMRLNDAVGMHAGFLPGYPASHGCVRLPGEIARMFYERVRVGTPVEIVH